MSTAIASVQSHKYKLHPRVFIIKTTHILLAFILCQIQKEFHPVQHKKEQEQKNCTYKLNNRPGVINSNDEMMKNENGKA